MISWKKQMKVYDDNRQTLLSPEGCTSRLSLNIIKGVEYTGYYYCPFCLHKAKMIDFRIRKGDGYSKEMVLCPDCNNRMMIRSLANDMTIEEYAEWVFRYSLNGFWGKCPFEKFSGRLKALGWSYQFWERYKELKGDSAEA